MKCIATLCSVPVRSIFDGLGDGIIAAAMSGDARFVVLIGYATPQVECVCACVHACMCVHIYVLCMHAHMHICVCACVCACLCDILLVQLCA